jgi:hypothetical protein
MFGTLRRGGSPRRGHPQQSTAFAGPSQNSRNLAKADGVAVPCVTHREGGHEFVSRAPAKPSAEAFPGRHDLCGRGTWRRGWAFARGLALCGFPRWAAYRCRRQFQRTAGSPRPWASAKTPWKSSPKSRWNPVPERRKKSSSAAELAGSTAVNGQTPGEAPQPLTLNHPVSNPGRFSGRGSSFWGTTF